VDPTFPKIKAVVTDTGGMLTHAAITAWNTDPAVVGTWRATKSITMAIPSRLRTKGLGSDQKV
jgi:phosphohistidine swiveling domain-containing protein